MAVQVKGVEDIADTVATAVANAVNDIMAEALDAERERISRFVEGYFRGPPGPLRGSELVRRIRDGDYPR